MLVICGDVVNIVFTYVLADMLRTRLYMDRPWPETLAGFQSPWQVHYWTLFVLPVVWPMVLRWRGWYEPQWRPLRWHARQAITAALVMALLLAGMALFLRREIFPRMQIVLFAALLPATTLMMRGITGWLGRWVASRLKRHILIVGTGRDAVRLRRLLRVSAMGRSTVVGHVRLANGSNGEELSTGAVLGDVRSLAMILDNDVIDEVFFAVRLDQVRDILPCVRLCEEVGVASHVLAESMVCHSAPELEQFHGIPMLGYSPVRHAPELLALKRVLDVILATGLILVTGPIMLLCAVLIRLSGAGAILFRQSRSGLNGRTFAMYKFRTMQADAEIRLAEVSHLNESDGPVFKARNDPRITSRIARIMRRYSLDELPQLFNVFKGDMSMVGPRPPIPEEVARYDRWQRRRLSMRPGLTCLWQIKGRHRLSFDEWMHLDLFYIDHWSLKLDSLIMLKTIGTVLSGSGA